MQERRQHTGVYLGMSASALAITPHLARVFGRSNRMPFGPDAELSLLLARIEHRLYRENVPVVASWWLKTVYHAGHNRAWWERLDATIGKVLSGQHWGATALEAIRDIQIWVRRNILKQHRAPQVQPLLRPPFRPNLPASQAAPYLSRLLNEWLPAEAAGLLTTEADSAGLAGLNETGMPPLAVAIVLERLLLREHHSPESLELLLEAAWMSPKYAYPAHVEILSDIVLALLGRTAAPASPVLPAMHLAGEFADAVTRALLVSSDDGDELHVPLSAAQAVEVLKHDPFRIGSIVVTMDGRWWESAHLQRGEETVIVYRPGKHLRIDFSSEHARLALPWPDAVTPSQGAVHLPEKFQLFGREWRARAWERNAERTWLHLEFSAVVTLPETLNPGNPRRRRLRPASVEIAWSEVEQALAAGASDSIDQLHRTDLIPLARALERLVACLRRPGQLSRGDFERSLMAVRYLHGAVAAVYGRIPWRVLSAGSRSALRKRCGAIADLLGEVFDGLPPDERTSRRVA
jgi:hypothetical protein